jgi:hypothetical protein
VSQHGLNGETKHGTISWSLKRPLFAVLWLSEVSRIFLS